PRHAIGRIADITADKHMEGVRLTRWLLSPVPTFLLWRRMKLWELRSYDQVIKLEQERLVYQARLRSRFGRAWRRKAPVESLMPLRLAKYGVPLAQTAPAGLAAAGIEPALIPPPPQADPAADSRAAGAARVGAAAPPSEQRPQLESNHNAERPDHEPEPDQSPWFNTQREVEYQGGYDPAYDPERYAQWIAEEQQAEQYLDQPQESPSPEDTGSFPIPVGPNRTRELGDGGGIPPAPEPDEEAYYQVFRESIKSGNGAPTPRGFIADVEATYGVALDEAESKRMVNRFSNRLNAELAEEHIA
ncbi:DUF2637 domain-containing protein, partial [Streptomyces sp. NRRL S-481]|uniref:DUF2637 domain-containing protein n=1 Tax=Streptomyces sp. NRRL S-481 TaxID=1463911 RepID=UPI000559E4D9